MKRIPGTLFSELNDAQLWFSQEFYTLEAAQDASPYSLFDGACVFITPNGRYVIGSVYLYQWTSDEISGVAGEIERISGHRIIAVRDALFNMWHKIEAQGE